MMLKLRKIFFLTFAGLLLPLSAFLPQSIGEMAPEKEPVVFPENSWGVDLLFGEGGFGLGTFYRKQMNSDFTFFADFSISETKDDKEIEYIDYYGQPIVYGKKNRLLLMPLNFGAHYRIFDRVLSDNLRPYLNLGFGPSMILTTPYSREFFNSLGYAQTKFTAGGYIGFGANFGLDKDNLIGINLRYYVIRFFDEGVESLYGKFKKDVGGFYLTINIGSQY